MWLNDLDVWVRLGCRVGTCECDTFSPAASESWMVAECGACSAGLGSREGRC